MELETNLLAKAARIKLLLMDCDGVLTDGRIYFGPDGEALKVFHARDGEGLTQWREAGLASGIISGRNSPMVALRAGQLGMKFVRQGRRDKADALREVLAESEIGADETCYIGDDSPDLEIFGKVAISVAVADAHAETLAAADLVTVARGGRGAVREIIDLLLMARGAVTR